MKGLSKALDTPWLLYVPFWCPDNQWSDQFRFLESYNPAMPHLIFAEPHPDDALAFYRALFDYGIGQGMAGYENDYLDYNYLSIPYLRRTYGAANKWLSAMNTAAIERHMAVQICMALPSDAMASVQFDSMTNVRASTDYGINDDRGDSPVQPGGIFGDSNYNIGGSCVNVSVLSALIVCCCVFASCITTERERVRSARSLLAFALGLRPSKDIFWSHRPSNCHGNHTDYPQTCGRWGEHMNPGSNCELNALISTLSTGPVSLADKAGDTNASLVRRCIR
jgi:hypothetical protein